MSFPLKRVLEHRQRIEDQRQADLVRAEQRLRQAAHEVAQAEQVRRTLLQRYQHLSTGDTIDGRVLIALRQQLHRLDEQILALRSAHSLAAREVLRTREQAVSASQDRLVIERARDLFLAEHLRQEQGRENERLNEVALIRWVRQSLTSENDTGSHNR